MKRLIVLVSLVTLICFGFVGCKEKSTTPPAETTAVAPAEETAAPEEAAPAPEEAAPAAEAK